MSARGRNRGRGGGRPQQRRRSGHRQRDQRSEGVGFWGDPSKLPQARLDVRLSDDPAAMARSLGPPPLTGYELIAEQYFMAIYDRAVMLAGALATAAGMTLVDDEEPDD